MTDNHIKPGRPILAKIAQRAAKQRSVANGSVVLVVAIVLAMIWFFYVSPGFLHGWAGVGVVALGDTKDLIYSVILPILSRAFSIFLALYLTQVLVGFTRYQYRMADHLDALAYALEIADNDAEKLVTLVVAFDPAHIDFGRMPAALSGRGLEVVKELFSRASKGNG